MVARSDSLKGMFPFFVVGTALLGWEFQFLILISGTLIGSRISIPFLILEILVGFFFEILMSEKSENWNSNLQNSEFR
jgi:hypothetical protein